MYLKQDGRRVIVIPDVHGELDKLVKFLSQLKVDYNKDLVMFLGDLIDRGPNSLEVFDFVLEHGFPCVRGNHEQMMINSAGDSRVLGLWHTNGGQWYRYISEDTLNHCIERANKLPYFIELETDQMKYVGLIHAEVSPAIDSWDIFKISVENTEFLKDSAIWGRRRIRKSNPVVKDIDLIIAGHTPVERPLVLGNHLFLDCGACFNGGTFYAWVLEPNAVKGKICKMK